MAYNGYLLKIGDYAFPMQYIMYNTYKAVRSVQDIDSYRDANGVLHRNALEHTLLKVEFQTRTLTNIQYDDIMNNIRARYSVAAERKVNADVFIPELGIYSGTVELYMPDPEIQIVQVLSPTVLKYNNVTFKFIQY